VLHSYVQKESTDIKTNKDW